MKALAKVELAFFIVVLAILGCRSGSQRTLVLYPSTTSTFANTPTQVLATQTPYIVEVTTTSGPTKEALAICVTADEAVYLRPSASAENYPILSLPYGSRLKDLGGRIGNWVFVQYHDNQGWVYGDYLGRCT
jgi:hypothetical protein